MRPWPSIRAAIAAAAGAAPAWAWRALAVTPPGRVHERHARRELGMGRRHPERVTRPPRRRHQAQLDRWQAELWPEGEYAVLLRLWLEDGTWRGGR